MVDSWFTARRFAKRAAASASNCAVMDFARSCWRALELLDAELAASYGDFPKLDEIFSKEVTWVSKSCRSFCWSAGLSFVTDWYDIRCGSDFFSCTGAGKACGWYVYLLFLTFQLVLCDTVIPCNLNTRNNATYLFSGLGPGLSGIVGGTGGKGFCSLPVATSSFHSAEPTEKIVPKVSFELVFRIAGFPATVFGKQLTGKVSTLCSRCLAASRETGGILWFSCVSVTRNA
jgi:hypothetical protein